MRTGYSYLRYVVLCLVLAIAAGCQSTGSERSTGKVVDDATITARVKSKLLADKEVSGLAVNVDTYKGTVQLNGFVNTAAEKAKAEQLAKSVEGVQKVDNNLTVKK